VPLELCPNLERSHRRLPSFAAHPLRCLFDQGLLSLLNSDDPAFFGSDLGNEFRLAHADKDLLATNSASSRATRSERASFPQRRRPRGWLALTPSSEQKCALVRYPRWLK